MFKLLKIKKQKKIEEIEDIIDAVDEVAEELHIEVKEVLPPIKLFVSVDQLAILKEVDEDREIQARMFLNSKEPKNIETAAYDKVQLCFEKSYLKLGNVNKECPHCKREYKSAPSEVKKCIGCGRAFFKTKRPQDGQTVLVREENRELIALQWENVRKAELIERIDLNHLERLRLKLEEKDHKRYTLYSAHFSLVRQYTERALLSGRFRLYSSFIFYMAEHDRYDKQFAKALMYYFYVYYLQLNGASNSVVFGDKVSVNSRITKRISDLLKMANKMTTDCHEFFIYSINKTTAFEEENLPYSIEESYVHLVKEFEESEGRTPVSEKIVEVKESKTKSFRLQR